MKNPWMNKTLFGITEIVMLRDMTKLEMLASASMLNAQIRTFSPILMNQRYRKCGLRLQQQLPLAWLVTQKEYLRTFRSRGVIITNSLVLESYGPQVMFGGRKFLQMFNNIAYCMYIKIIS